MYVVKGSAFFSYLETVLCVCASFEFLLHFHLPQKKMEIKLKLSLKHQNQKTLLNQAQIRKQKRSSICLGPYRDKPIMLYQRQSYWRLMCRWLSLVSGYAHVQQTFVLIGFLCSSVHWWKFSLSEHPSATYMSNRHASYFVCQNLLVCVCNWVGRVSSYVSKSGS